MSAPAVAAWRRLHPEARLIILARPGPAAVWRLLGLADEVWNMAAGTRGAWRAARALRAWRPDWVAVCPHSVRASWLAALSGAAEVVGLPGFARRWFGIRVVRPLVRADRRHQRFEYADLLLGPGADLPAERLHLRVLPDLEQEAESRLTSVSRRPRIAIMPGAARGPAKRWPEERFAEAARRLATEDRVSVVVLGGRGDLEAARLIATAAGPETCNLAGQTTVELWAAVLSRCDLALCNDSGGMHLAAAVGLPGVALFGRTDPAVTGPMSPEWTILRAPGPGSRDVPRTDAEAVRRLQAIGVEDVVRACREQLAATARRRAAGGLGT